MEFEDNKAYSSKMLHINFVIMLIVITPKPSRNLVVIVIDMGGCLGGGVGGPGDGFGSLFLKRLLATTSSISTDIARTTNAMLVILTTTIIEFSKVHTALS